MTKTKDFLKRVLRFLGFHRDSEYVKEYLNNTNLRISIPMCFVILSIEVWMIIRQTTKYFIPLVSEGSLEGSFANFWSYTGNFWTLFFIATSLMFFSISKIYFKKRKARFVLNLTLGLLALTSSFMVIYSAQTGRFSNWSDAKHIYTNAFTITVYCLGVIYSIGLLTYTCLSYFKGKEIRLLCQAIIAVFGFICLVFGMMVSFSDFLGTARVAGVPTIQYKEIICFLTMIVYTACLLVYRPIISFTVLGAAFFFFYRLILSVESVRVFPDGDKVNYLTFVLMLIVVVSALYSQRLNDATKSEELEFKAKYDELTKLYNFDHFVSLVKERNLDVTYPIEKKVFLFSDIDDFKAYNDRRGFEKGNGLIAEIGTVLAKEFGNDNIAHVYADRFAFLCDADAYEGKLRSVRDAIKSLDEVSPINMRFGVYRFHRRDEDPRRAYDKARFAARLVRPREVLFVEYDDELDRLSHLNRRIVHSIDLAIEKGYIRPHYQPVVWSKDGTLCGVEALCRWNDPKYGNLSPAAFVPALEQAREIHRLDACILESVLRDLREALDNDLPVVPVSINFSRLDFELMDPVALLESLIEKYKVPKNLLHVEITESALSRDTGNMMEEVGKLRDLGYAIWLDDFGSGYSSFNVLKDFHFDVLKIDMQFLTNFENNKNSRIIIETIVNMCERLGVRTLTEGVETEEEEEFLREVGCERLQGYRYGKALSKAELREKIAKGELKLTDHLD